MGWSYRKSASFGPFRINVSKEGLVRVLAGTRDNGQTSHEVCYGPVKNPGQGLWTC
jgi:hypothetical protein